MKLHRLTTLLAAAALAAATLQADAGPAEATTATDEFVQRDGSRLTLHGETFRFAGTNVYWLGLDENVGGIDYPTYFRIADALDTAKAMGFTVVRSHMLTSSGHELTLRPTGAREYNDAAFDTIDFAVAHAGRIGMRLMLPLTDEWEYYHGGHRDFTDPYGLPSEAFYTDDRVIADYQDYVSHAMHHVNPLTGLAYNEDPTIMAWEFGNELNGMTPQWLAENAAKFRQWAPNQLIAAGKQFGVDPAALATDDVDIVDVHYYPPSVDQVQADAAAVTAAGKVYVAGEYGSISASTDLLKPLAEDPNVTGMLSWSLFGHADEHGFVPHDDGFTMHYPGDTPDMAENVSAQVEFARLMSGRPSPVELGAPMITEVAKLGGFNVVAWRGTAGAVGYELQRSSRTEHGPWTTVHGGRLTDNDTPYIDDTGAGGLWYRVVPFDRDGASGQPSDPLWVSDPNVVTVDPLETVYRASADQGVAITPYEDRGVAGPTGDGAAWVSWSADDIHAVTFHVIAHARHIRSLGVEVQSSDDGEKWRTVRSTVRPVPGKRSGPERVFSVAASVGSAGHVRLLWSPGSPATLDTATVWSTDPAPVAEAPGSVELTEPAHGDIDVGLTPTLTWAAADGAAYYDVVLATSADLSGPVTSAAKLTGTEVGVDVPLEPDSTYYWQVTATNAHGSTRSEVGSFTTRGLPTESATIDDFESYPSNDALAAAYPANPGGDSITPTLLPHGAGQAMSLAFDLVSAGYAGVIHTLDEPRDLWGYQGLELWLDATAAGANVTVQFVAAGAYWETTLDATAIAEPGVVQIPFADFAPPPWASPGPLDLSEFQEMSIYVGGSGTGSLVVDTIAAYPPTP